jgi:hypothetical protein
VSEQYSKAGPFLEAVPALSEEEGRPFSVKPLYGLKGSSPLSSSVAASVSSSSSGSSSGSGSRSKVEAEMSQFCSGDSGGRVKKQSAAGTSGRETGGKEVRA